MVWVGGCTNSQDHYVYSPKYQVPPGIKKRYYPYACHIFYAQISNGVCAYTVVENVGWVCFLLRIFKILLRILSMNQKCNILIKRKSVITITGFVPTAI